MNVTRRAVAAILLASAQEPRVASGRVADIGTFERGETPELTPLQHDDAHHPTDRKIYIVYSVPPSFIGGNGGVFGCIVDARTGLALPGIAAIARVLRRV